MIHLLLLLLFLWCILFRIIRLVHHVIVRKLRLLFNLILLLVLLLLLLPLNRRLWIKSWLLLHIFFLLTLVLMKWLAEILKKLATIILIFYISILRHFCICIKMTKISKSKVSKISLSWWHLFTLLHFALILIIIFLWYFRKLIIPSWKHILITLIIIKY